MAIEKRVVFGLRDIASIRLNCKKCGNGARWEQTSTTVNLPIKCSFCGEAWERQYSHLWQTAENLVRLIRLNGRTDGDESFEIRFEVPAVGSQDGSGSPGVD